MQTDLFPNINDIPSPKLLWIKDNKISILQNPKSPYKPWTAEDDRIIGFGETEEDALCDFAIKKGIRLWNEVF